MAVVIGQMVSRQTCSEMLAFNVCDRANTDVFDGAEFKSAICHDTTNLLPVFCTLCIIVLVVNRHVL